MLADSANKVGGLKCYDNTSQLLWDKVVILMTLDIPVSIVRNLLRHVEL